MKKLLILILLSMPMMAFAQQIDTKLLQGTWFLSDIQSKDSIWIAPSKNAQISSNSKGSASEYRERKISLVEYMMKDLSCGVTRFEFSGSSFKFYRKDEVTFSGTYTVNGQTLILAYDNGAGKTTKENTVVNISSDKLVLASESKEKPVLMSFVRK